MPERMILASFHSILSARFALRKGIKGFTNLEIIQKKIRLPTGGQMTCSYIVGQARECERENPCVLSSQGPHDKCFYYIAESA